MGHDSEGSTRVAVVASLCAVLVAVCVVVAILFGIGAILPPDTAARYGVFKYVSEQEVTDYIDNYRTNIAGTSSDEAWASYLSGNNTTPQELRESTIYQLVIDKRVNEVAEELGVSATDEQIEQRIAMMKNAFGVDDSTWEQTLAMYGQTEEGYREVTAQSVTQENVTTQEVPRTEPTDDQLFIYLYGTYTDEIDTKHVYYITVDGLDEDGSYDKFEAVNGIRKEFESGKLTAERFGQLAQEYCTNSTIAAAGGDLGWDINTSLLSTQAQKEVERLKVGEVSEAFAEDNGYSFIWISEDCHLDPISEMKNPKQKKILSSIPESLLTYFKEQCTEALWQEDCNEYLQKLYDDAQVKIADMPSGLSYDVDMSLASSESSESASSADANESSNNDTSKDAPSGNDKSDSKKSSD